jgi:hypothetical protein
MTTITANIVLDSVSPDGIRLTTIHMRYPRFIHAELMTHRVFSRNARSSRAVPVATMLREIETDPVVPLHWGANQKGMQADRENNRLVGSYDFENGQAEFVEISREAAWLKARDWAVIAAKGFMEADYHKQVVNRILEPYMHIDVLVSATEWGNFLALRDHHMAEPHIAMLAREVRAAIEASEPTLLQPDEWHLPYVTSEEWLYTGGEVDDLRKLSVARCARISYKPFDGNADWASEIERYDALVGSAPMHASPAEHQATPDIRRANGVGGYCGWWTPEEHGNFTGWRQYRKMLPGENAA